MALEAGAELRGGIGRLVRLEYLVFPFAVAIVVGILAAPAGALLHHAVAGDGIGLDEVAIGVLLGIALRVELGGVVHHGDHGAARQRLALLRRLERRGAGVELAERLAGDVVERHVAHAFGIALRKRDLVAAGAAPGAGGGGRDRRDDEVAAHAVSLPCAVARARIGAALSAPT